MLQLKPMISVVTPLGAGQAILISEDEMDTHWTVVLDKIKDGGCPIVTFPQHKVRVQRNYSAELGLSDQTMKGILK